MTTEQPRFSGAALRRSPSPEEYEGCPPDMFSADQLGLLERIHKDFLHLFEQEISSYLETAVAISMTGLQQMALKEFLSEEEGDCLITLDVESVPGQAYLSLQNTFVTRVLDILLKTPTKDVSSGRTSITDIEIHILQEFFASLVGALQKAWEICGAHFKVVSIGSAPPDSPVASSGVSMMVVTSAVQFEDAPAQFRLALPALLVRVAAVAAVDSASVHGSGGAHSDTLEALRTATLQVEALLDGSTLRMRDLLAMEPGQVLMLGKPAGSSFDCVVNGKAKFRGELLHSGGRQALQIGSRVAPGTRG